MGRRGLEESTIKGRGRPEDGRDRWRRLLTQINRGWRRRELARARGQTEGRKVVGRAMSRDCSRSCARKTAREVAAPEFAHGVDVSEGVERDVDEPRLLTQSSRARSGRKEGGGGSGGSSRTPSSCVEKRREVVAIVGSGGKAEGRGSMMMATARGNKCGAC